MTAGHFFAFPTQEKEEALLGQYHAQDISRQAEPAAQADPPAARPERPDDPGEDRR